MYCEGCEAGVREWVGTVQRLRYKDFQLVKKVAELEEEGKEGGGEDARGVRRGGSELALGSREKRWGRLEEVESVREFGALMEGLGVWKWWRRGMGFVGE